MSKILYEQAVEAEQRLDLAGMDRPIMWHFHGAKPWDVRCMAAYLVGAITRPDPKSKQVEFGPNKRVR